MFFVKFSYEKKTVLYIDVKQTTLFSESVNAVLESVLKPIDWNIYFNSYGSFQQFVLYSSRMVFF